MKIKDAIHPDQNERLAYLRAENERLNGNLSSLVARLGKQQELADRIAAAVPAAEPLRPLPRPTTARPGTPVAACLLLSDFHIGERISAAETEGFGAFDWSVAQKRLRSITEDFVRWIQTQRHGYKIDQCAVFGLGDYISGDIHRELSVTAEFPVPVQAAKAGVLIGETVARLASAFRSVDFYAVGADNHGRLTPKPQCKQKATNSMSFVVHAIARAYLASHRNVRMVEAEGMKYVATVAGWKFLLEHGDTVRAWMGIPYYGLERERAREATRRMNTDRTFHYEVMGHWHLPGLVAGNIIVNGSLSGTSEYDHAAGRHSPPAQVAFLVSPKHGLFNLVPFHG